MIAATGAVSPTGERHPGQIEYDDRVEDRTWTQAASEVPTSVAWVEVDDVWRPVVRLELRGAGDAREIVKYGADHALLEITTGRITR